MAADRRRMITGMAAMGAMAALPFGEATAETTSSPFAGIWSGTLQAGPTALRLQLEISPDLEVVVTSLDQGNARLPAQGVKANAKSITILIPTVGASYEAELTETGSLDGRFTQAGQTFPLTMQRGAAAVSSPAGSKPEPMSTEQLQALRVKLGTPGVGAGWQRGETAPTILVDGLRSADAILPVKPDDHWHIGSIGKSMTATLAARAVEAGMIGWDSSVPSVLGKAIPDIHPGFAEVSLLHLLCHRSGLAAAAGQDRLADYPMVRSDDIHDQRIRFARAVLTVAPATPTGTVMAYANAGYVIAAAMLETSTGKPWEALVQYYVFGALGLESAGIGLPGKQGAVDQPLGHTIGAGGKRVPHFTDLPAVLGPAGLVHMSLADLLAYLAAHRDGHERLLRKASWQKLHAAPFGGNYALGWVVLPNGMLMHNGSNGSWLALAMFEPKGTIAAAFAGNDPAAMGMQAAIVQSLLSAARGEGAGSLSGGRVGGKVGVAAERKEQDT